MKPEELTKRYRDSRSEGENHLLTNTVSLAADMLFKLAAGKYRPEQEKDVWEMVEKLITQYAEKNINELPYEWVAEYSHQQKCFHVQPSWKMIKGNIQTIIVKRNIDFMPFGIYQTRDEAHEACDKMRKAQRRQDAAS